MTSLDLGVLELLNRFARRLPALDGFVVLLAENDLVKGGLLIAVLWYFWVPPHRDSVRRERVVACIAAAMASALVSRGLTHLLPYRPRPIHAPGLNFVMPFGVLGGSDAPGHSSFPSDHSALAFALAAGLYSFSPALGVTAIVYTFVFVAAPRVYVGFHWATDILASAALGIGMTWLANRQRVRAALSGPVLRWHERSPGAFYAGMFLVTFELATRFDAARDAASWAFHAASAALASVR